jgi:hypothetical protein
MSRRLLTLGSALPEGTVAHSTWVINAASFPAPPPAPSLDRILNVAPFKSMGVYIPDASQVDAVVYVGTRNHRVATISNLAQVNDPDLLAWIPNSTFLNGFWKVFPIPTGVSALTLSVNIQVAVGVHFVFYDLFTARMQPASKTTFI